MGVIDLALLAVTRPSEFRSLVHYKIWRDPLNDIKENPQESGWDRERMRDCWKLLDLTSRSFSAVIKELRGGLSRVICIYYLILRALDTVEDDMTLPLDVKIPLLLSFYKKLETPGWNFTESGPDEKDRQLLVEFDKVIDEFQMLDEPFRVVISDMTAKMGAGMASYIEASDSNASLSVIKWSDYDLYCHFVAGLVGEGLSRLFSASGSERPWLGEQLVLSNHMGLFLQKTNVIRDYAEDSEQGRFFWPKECWAAPECGFSSQKEVASGIVETAPGSRKFKPVEGELGRRSMNVLSGMILDALSHATYSLDYLAVLREQSVFNFCAIPQIMAIATLELMVNNPDVLKRNVKIRKSLAVQLILKATNPRDVAYTFRDFGRRMHAKLSPEDPYFTQWSIELGRIEIWSETYYPSWVTLKSDRVPGIDVRKEAMKQYADERKKAAVLQARTKRAALGDGASAESQMSTYARTALSADEQDAKNAQDTKDLLWMFTLMMGVFTVIVVVAAIIMFEIMWYWTDNSGQQDPLSILAVSGWHHAKAKSYEVSAHLLAWASEIGGGVKQGAGKIEL